MRRSLAAALGFGCVLALFASCFHRALLNDEQFAYRDAGHFYYPLYERVQQEWAKGRVPLWDARENSGMPLLGNPTAAVLYPGKLIYAALPYPWAARAYPIAHVLLAMIGTFLLMRSWRTSQSGSLLAAMAYGFGAPILFQYCNIIFLVGAAWVPFGLWAIDGWLRTGRRLSMVGLAIVLSMQALGGDPEAAYVMGLCAGGYAIGLTIARRRQDRRVPPISSWKLVASASLVLVIWIAVVFACALLLPGTRAKGPPVGPVASARWFPYLIDAVWLAVGLTCLAKPHLRRGPLATMFAGLGFAGLLAGLLSAAQLLPVFEFTGKTMRAAPDGPHDIYPFSLEPYRLAEAVWPEVLSSNRDGNHAWGVLIPPAHKAFEWVPSIYLGGLTLVLALSAIGLRGLGARRVWLSWIVVVSTLAALGEYAGPLWIARCVPQVAKIVGEHDPFDSSAIRADGQLRDGDGSVYNLMTLFLPGFSGFRYPSKLLTFTSVGVAGLAGIGLDRVLSGRWRKAMTIALVFATMSAILLFVVASPGRSVFLGWLESRQKMKGQSVFGPFSPEGAWRGTRSALAQGTILFGLAVVVIALAKRWPRLAASSAIVLVAVDLMVANAPLVLTVPQSLFETPPELVAKLVEAEAADPSPGPFRIHRMSYWDPTGFSLKSSPNRYRELFEWERRTIQPKYAIPFGLSYTQTEGVADLYDYSWFFAPFRVDRNIQAGTRSSVSVDKVVYFPRKAFDLWATRYFLVPAVAANDERRANFSFLFDVEPVYPTQEQFRVAGFLPRWEREEDWRLVKNRNAFPRTWIVHNIELRTPIEGFSKASRDSRQSLMETLLYGGDIYWNAPSRTVQDLRNKAYVETADGTELYRAMSREDRDPKETVDIVVDDDQKVVIEASLTSPGLVVLADIDYPGWELYIDGKRTPIHRTNRMMRGAAVPSGNHRLVYVYNPMSARLGRAISVSGIVLALGLALWCQQNPRSPRLSASW